MFARRSLLDRSDLVAFGGYTVTSGVAFLIDLSVLLVCVEHLETSRSTGAAAGFVAGLLANFLLCRAFVFPCAAKPPFTEQFCRFALSGIAGLLATVILVEALAAHARLPLPLAKTLSAAVVLLTNFYIRSTYVFGRSS